MEIARLSFRYRFRRYSWITRPDADGMSWAGWSITKRGARRAARRCGNVR